MQIRQTHAHRCVYYDKQKFTICVVPSWNSKSMWSVDPRSVDPWSAKYKCPCNVTNSCMIVVVKLDHSLVGLCMHAHVCVCVCVCVCVLCVCMYVYVSPLSRILIAIIMKQRLGNRYSFCTYQHASIQQNIQQNINTNKNVHGLISEVSCKYLAKRFRLY